MEDTVQLEAELTEEQYALLQNLCARKGMLPGDLAAKLLIQTLKENGFFEDSVDDLDSET